MKSERRVKMGFLRLHSLYPIQPPKTSTLNPQIQEDPSSIVFVVQIRKKTMTSFRLTHQDCKMRNHINNISPLRVLGVGGGGKVGIVDGRTVMKRMKAREVLFYTYKIFKYVRIKYSYTKW